MKTSYGLQFNVLTPNHIDNFVGYNKSVAQCHITNCGYIITDIYGDVIDNEYDLDEIYSIISK